MLYTCFSIELSFTSADYIASSEMQYPVFADTQHSDVCFESIRQKVMEVVQKVMEVV